MQSFIISLHLCASGRNYLKLNPGNYNFQSSILINFPSLQKKILSESIILEEGLSKKQKYEALIPQLVSLVKGESDLIANTANIVAALKEAFSFFWIGIYFVKERNGTQELVLGPFQGPPACVRIAKGKGVCGTAWDKKTTIVVPDVDQFPGHIACSALSKSEIVVPVIKNNTVVAVLDIDSTKLSDFDVTDEIFLNEVAKIISEMI
jgi:L-methionine (R)-S-oxide reductase